RSGVTIANYRATFDLLLRWFPITDLVQLTEPLLRQFFRRGEAARAWKPSTTDSYRKNLAPFLHWCRDKGFVTTEPLTNIPKPVVTERIPDFYTDDELERILYFIEVHSDTAFERAR